MGKVVSSSIPNLIGGVSQQPDAIRLPTQAKEVVNCYPSVVEFLKRRGATRHVAKIISDQVDKATMELLVRDETERYLLMITDGDLKVFGLDGSQKTVNFPNGKGYLSSPNANKDFSLLTINDHTFIVNRKKVTAMSPALTPTRVHEALVFVKQASYATTYFITIDNVTVEHTTPTQSTELVQSTVIIDDLMNKLVAAVGSEFTFHIAKSSLWVTRNDGGDFVLTAQDTRANTQIVAIKQKVQKFSDLPVVAPDGFVVEITGDTSSSFDNYFVKFTPSATGHWFSDGVWTETVKQGIKHTFDATTMPHVLVREADGTFTFRQNEWDSRTCGDEDSAPEPSFVGRTISNVFYYKNRLAFLAAENVIMSATGEFFRFWPSTVTTMVDSDPVDAAASHTKVAALEHAVTFSGGLLLFSSTTQYSVEHDDVLSNETIAIKPITEFEASMKAPPVSGGRTVFFAVDKGQYGGVREYFTMADGETNDAADITAHVPQYVKGGIYKIVCSTNEDVLFVLTEGDPNAVFVYKYYWNGDDKIQSAWTKWEMAGAVRGISVLNTEVYLTIQYSDGLYLEKIDLEPGYADADLPFELKLDRKITEASCGLLYDDLVEETVVTLPYPLEADHKPAVIARPGGSLDVGVNIPYRFDPAFPTYLFLQGGDYTQDKFYLGVCFESRFVFSKQVMRESNGTNQVTLLQGRLQLRGIKVTYHATGYFEAIVKAWGREPSVYRFTGQLLGNLQSTLGSVNLYTGTFNIPVLSKNDQVDIELVSDSVVPFNFISADWEGYFNTRSSRI